MVRYRQEIDRKPVLVITTGQHAEDGIVTSKKGLVGRKPLLIHNYNQSMGGVDVSDKWVYHLSRNRQTTKYWKKVFLNFTDLYLFNAFTLYKFSRGRPISRRDFHISVLETLVKSGDVQVLQFAPGPSGDTPHHLEHLPRRQERTCAVCAKTKPQVGPTSGALAVTTEFIGSVSISFNITGDL